MEFICYPKCTTCKKAQQWLVDKGLSFNIRNIKEENPTVDELKNWHKKSNLELKKFFNTSGLKYKELGLATKLAQLTEEEQYHLLSSDGMLVKRPILVTDETVLVGFKEKDWIEKI